MKRSAILPFVLSVALVCAVALLSMTYSRMRTAEQTIERLYESSLASSCEQLQQLQLSLDKVLLVPDQSVQADMLGDIGRQAALVQTYLTSLPLGQPMLLSATGMTGRLAQDTQDMLPALRAGYELTDEQLECLKTAGSECALLFGQLAIIGQSGTWQPLGASAETDVSDIPVVRRDTPVGLPEGNVTRDEAMTIAAQIVGEGRVRRVLPSSGTTGVLPAHGAAVETADLQLNLEITQQGGQLLWMMPETASFTPALSTEVCREAAESFMNRLGYPPMTLTAWQQYDGLYVASYVPTQEGVLLYPDIVHVQVRMDTGEVVGFEAASYWTHHVARDMPQPALTTDEARALVASHADVEDVKLCLITQNRAEVLCHQVHAVFEGEDYYIYLDAQTGRTVSVQKLIFNENGIQPA